MIVALRAWFMGRAERERWLIAAMLAIALPLLTYLLVYAPLARALEEAKERHVVAVEQNAQAKGQLVQLSETPGPARASAPGNLALLVGGSAGRSNVVLASTEPRGDGIAVSLSGGSPTAALRWLQELEAQGVVVTDLQLTPASDGTTAISAHLAQRTGR